MKPIEFFRFFNPQKSPSTQINKKGDGYDYYTKHHQPKGHVAWDSKRKGTYIKAIHGAL